MQIRNNTRPARIATLLGLLACPCPAQIRLNLVGEDVERSRLASGLMGNKQRQAGIKVESAWPDLKAP